MKKYIVHILFSIIYLVGVVGLTIPETRDLFASATPINLSLLLITLFVFHKKWNAKLALVLFAIAFLGFAVEVLGVKTGFPFGEYEYVKNLGPKVLDVPILIGLNWAMLVYCSTYMARNWVKNPFLLAFVASLLMLVLDLLLEQFAIRFELWSWGGDIPIENFIAWFVIAYLLNLIWVFVSKIKHSNKFANYALIVQAVFFAVLFLLNKTLE